jgi:hypothetical protein
MIALPFARRASPADETRLSWAGIGGGWVSSFLFHDVVIVAPLLAA